MSHSSESSERAPLNWVHNLWRNDMNTATTNQLFEAHAKRQDMDLTSDDCGRYKNSETADAWTKWHAEATANVVSTPTLNIITPTVGRKVWFRGIPYDALSRLPAGTSPTIYGDQPLDATIVYVWGDRMVNVDVVDHGGLHWCMSSVPLVQDGDLSPAGSFVEWMPYQLGQAKKG